MLYPIVGRVDVSVIVPAFNSEHYIRGAIQSAQEQTIANIEIIVVDDASTDSTAKVVGELATRDRRIRYNRMAANLGPASSRNRGLEMARGDWIALLDSDDRFHPQRLERLLSFVDREGGDLVSDNVIRCMGSDRQPMISPEKLSSTHQMSFKEFILGCMYDVDTPPGVNYAYLQPLVKRSFLSSKDIKYNEGVRYAEDLILYFDCFVAGAKWILVPEAMYYYTIRDDSLTSTFRSQDMRPLVDEVRLLLGDPRICRDLEVEDALQKYFRLIRRDYLCAEVRNAVLSADVKSVLSMLLREPASLRFIADRIIRRLVRLLRYG
jgi:glycosyltransferase involved in cell wall biosynthesis